MFKKPPVSSFNKAMLMTLGQNIYFKKKKSMLNVGFIFKRFMLPQYYEKNRRDF